MQVQLTNVKDSSEDDTMDDYLALLIQFGYISMFAAMAPWASFFCALINMLDLRTDCWKLLYSQQRGRHDVSKSIGIW